MQLRTICVIGAAIGTMAVFGTQAMAGAKVSSSDQPGAVSAWKAAADAAGNNEVGALDALLRSVTSTPGVAGPRSSTFDPSSLRVAIANADGRVAVAANDHGICFTAAVGLSPQVAATCTEHLHPTGISWGVTHYGSSAHIAGVADDEVQKVEVILESGQVQTATLENNGFVWSGEGSVEGLRVTKDAQSALVKLA